MNNIELKSKVMSKVTKTQTGCWEYKNGDCAAKYGIVCFNGIQETAHRVSYLLFNGEINNMQVLHKCDNTRCINPEHLFLGTQADNVADMLSKNRTAKGINNGSGFLLDGEVVEIRRLKLEENMPTKIIAEKYKCSKVTIQSILNVSTYKHVKEPQKI